MDKVMLYQEVINSLINRSYERKIIEDEIQNLKNYHT